jgi:hypothetical protein
VLAEGNGINGPHQGGLVDTPSGEWWFIHFQSKGIYGRVCHLQPARWGADDWIVLGEDPDGDGVGAPVLGGRKPDVGVSYPIENPQTSDDFASRRLGRQWQWQAHEQPAWYSLTARRGFLRLYAEPCPSEQGNIYYAGNLLGNEERVNNFVASAPYLGEGGVKREIGMLYPDTPIVVNTARMGGMQIAFTLFRDYTDYAHVCDLTIHDGMLDRIRALILPIDGYYKTETLDAICAYAERGGVVIGINLKELRCVESDEDYLTRLFGADGKGQGSTLNIFGTMGGKAQETQTSSNFVVTNTPDHLRAMQSEICDVMTDFLGKHGIHVSDGQLDGVYTAEREGKLLTMNYSGHDIERDFTRPDGTKFHRTIKDLAIEAYDL